jgi:hypothetical protein
MFDGPIEIAAGAEQRQPLSKARDARSPSTRSRAAAPGRVTTPYAGVALDFWSAFELLSRVQRDEKPARMQSIPRHLRFTRKTNRRYSQERGCWVYDPQDVSYPCDAFDDWQDNLRAIALSMESLRRVERYGVFKYDEIISRLALPSAEGKVSTRESAAAFMAQHSGVAMKEILFSDTARSAAYRKAAQALHPDAGGNTEEFVKLQEANKVLSAAT